MEYDETIVSFEDFLKKVNPNLVEGWTEVQAAKAAWIASSELSTREFIQPLREEQKKLEFQLDAFGGWLIIKNCPTSVLEEFRKARVIKR